MILAYLCYHSSTCTHDLQAIAIDVHMTASTVQKYIDSLVTKKLVSKDGTPALKCEDAKFFTLPNEIFLLQLPPSAFIVYAYLLLIEERQTHTCHPNYNTIATAKQVWQRTP